MKKITRMFYAEKQEHSHGSFTGLILELEDGTKLQHQSTDPIMTFEPILIDLPEDA